MSSLKWSRLSLPLVVVIGFAVTNNLHWGKHHWSEVLKVDARGYNAYLPAVFIYQDLQFDFFEELEMQTYFNPNVTYEYRTKTETGTVNRYFVGTSILQVPFFLTARVWAKLGGYPDDGFSRPFPLMITLAGLFYLWLGLWAVNGFLKRFKTTEWSRGVVILLLAFGTHLFNYSIVDPGMSHVYSFAMVSLFLWLADRFFHGSGYPENMIAPDLGSKYQLIWMAIVYGLVCLIRPVNAIVILSLPIVAGSWSVFQLAVLRSFRDWKAIMLSMLSWLAVVAIQPLIYKIQTGKYWVASYADEGFNWLDPHMVDILFSYKKGLFLYTPLLLLSLFGLIRLFRKNRFQALSLAGFLIVATYVLSSWWSWWYGGSFSGRAFVEYIPFFAVPLVVLLDESSKGLKRIVLPLAFVLLALNQFQTYQYRYYIIHWDSMDKERYWDVFLSLDKPESPVNFSGDH